MRYGLAFLICALLGTGALAQRADWETALSESIRLREEKSYVQALSAAEKALALIESEPRADREDVSSVLTQLGMIHWEQGEFLKGEPYFLRALAVSEAAFGRDSPKLEADLMHLAGNYVGKKEYESAEKVYLRLLGIKETARGRNSYDLVEQLRALARLYRLQGRLDDSESLINRTLKMWPVKVFGVRFDGTSTELQNLAALRVDKGRYEEAGALYLRALDILERDLVEARASTVGPGNGTYGRLVDCLERLVTLNRKMGKGREAADFDRRAAIYRSEIQPPVMIGRPPSWGQAVFEINP